MTLSRGINKRIIPNERLAMNFYHAAYWPMLTYFYGDMAKEVFCDLHYDRFTYYPVHERPRFERDYVKREVC
jgi:hypothetical protein